MLVIDAAWWLVAMRLTKRRLWRILASVFIAAQMAAHFSLMCGIVWYRHAPKAAFLAVVTWHYFGLAALLVLGIVRAGACMVRAITRITGVRRNRPVATPAGTTSLTRREFIGACAALAPPFFTSGSTAVALAQMNHLRVRRFALQIPTLPRALDGITIAHLSDMHVGG
jgi:hypothetical protein